MAFVAKGYFFTEGRGRMYLSELFLRTLEREHSSTAVQTALITCNRELCRRMGGIFDEGDCIRYFFYTDQNDEIRKPNENYQELIDFWDVYWGYDSEVCDEVKNKRWILQMIYEMDCNRIMWEADQRRKEMSSEQIESLNMLCKEFEDKIGKKNLVLLRQERGNLKVWSKFELHGFDGEKRLPERDFAENELIKMFQSDGIVVLIVGRIGLTPRRFYGYRLSNNNYKKMRNEEVENLKIKLAEDNIMAEYRGRIRGNGKAFVDKGVKNKIRA